MANRCELRFSDDGTKAIFTRFDRKTGVQEEPEVYDLDTVKSVINGTCEDDALTQHISDLLNESYVNAMADEEIKKIEENLNKEIERVTGEVVDSDEGLQLPAVYESEPVEVVEEKNNNNHALLKAGLIALAVVLGSGALWHHVIKPIKEKNASKLEQTDKGNAADEFSALKEDKRVTEITVENVTEASKLLINEFADNGITITGEDALSFVALANVTHLKETNPELLNEMLGENANFDTVAEHAGNVIGRIVSLEISPDTDVAIDWTAALLDNTDKQIADAIVTKVVNGAKEIVRNPEMTEEQKAVAIHNLIDNLYLAQEDNFAASYTLNDGTTTTLRQLDGADFVTDAIITGTLLGDSEITNYVCNSTRMKLLTDVAANPDKYIDSNETFTSEENRIISLLRVSHNYDNTSNLMEAINGCLAESAKQITK